MKITKKPKVLLIVPPQIEHIAPLLGPAMLTGYLKHNGYFVLQRDLNVEFTKYLLKNININLLNKRAIDASPSALRKIINYLKIKYQNLLYSQTFNNTSSTEELDFLSRRISGFDEKELFDYSRLFKTNENSVSEFIENRSKNIYHNFFSDSSLASFVKSKKINLIGISILSRSQIIPGLTICHLIKHYFPAIKIVLGGPFMTLFKNEFVSYKLFRKYYDYIITHEGETAFLNLIKNLEQNNFIANPNLYNVHNLIFWENDRPIKTPVIPEVNFNILPPPDFDGIPLKYYNISNLVESNKLPSLVSEKGNVLTIQTCRSCYWGKCQFCVHLNGKYRIKQIDQIMKELKYLTRKYQPVRFIYFADDAISPKYFRELSRRILKEKIKIKWWCFLRFEKAFKRNDFILAKKAGCDWVHFGLETVSKRLNNLLQKGNDIKTVANILNICHKTGIKVDVSAMVGLPSESKREAHQTVDFLKKHSNLINRAWVIAFILQTDIPIFMNPNKFNIKVIKTKQTEMFKRSEKYLDLKKGCVSKKEAVALVKDIHNHYSNVKNREKIKTNTNPTISLSKILNKAPLIPKMNYFFEISLKNKASNKLLLIENESAEASLIINDFEKIFIKLCNGKNNFSKIFYIMRTKFPASIFRKAYNFCVNLITNGYIKIKSPS